MTEENNKSIHSKVCRNCNDNYRTIMRYSKLCEECNIVTHKNKKKYIYGGKL